MNDVEINHHTQAEAFFSKAQEGLMKPEEDIVPYQVSENSFRAVKAYLQSYLINQLQKAPASDDLEELISSITAIDASFSKLHLEQMFKPTTSEDVWMSLNTARLFFSLAEKTREKVSQL